MDEIGQLAVNFNEMASQIWDRSRRMEQEIIERIVAEEELKKHRTQLEDLVSERTDRLTKANARLEQEIVQRKGIEHALKRSKEDAEGANRLESEFLANMSHEIRTPLNAILGFSKLMSNAAINEKQKRYAKSIISSGKNLPKLIDDILDLSKIEAGKLTLQYDPIHLNVVLEEVKNIFQLKASEKRIQLTTQIDPKFPEAILLDEVRIRQVLFNLVGNAVKFTERGSVTVKINFSDVKEKEINVTIQVVDTGIGIEGDKLDSIFEAFQQIDGQDTRKYGGTGLGLAITKRLVHIMGGNITVSSTPNQGSEFQVIFPNIKVAAKEELSVASEFEDTLEDIDLSQATILVVDDDRSNREIIRSFLESTQAKVIEAEDGKQAIALTKRFRPGLIVMDLRMPIMGGYQTIGILKSDTESQQTPDHCGNGLGSRRSRGKRNTNWRR